MRILYILHQFFPEFGAGTERVTLNLAHCMQHAGHYVHVLACAMHPSVPRGASFESSAVIADYVWESIPVTVLRSEAVGVEAESGFWTRPRLVAHLTDWIRSGRFDCVHVMHSMRMASAVRAAQLSELPIIVTLTDFFSVCHRVNLITASGELCTGPEAGQRCARECSQGLWSPALLLRRHEQAQEWLSSASHVVAPSEYVAETIGRILPQISVDVIAHGINPSGLRRRQRMALAANEKAVVRFAYIGSIVPEKGALVLLKAFSKVTASNVSLTVIGGSYGDSDYARSVRELAEGDDRIELVGELAHDAVSEALYGFDGICIPSLVPETFSMVYHEAKAAGVPSLVSNLGAPARDVELTGVGKVVSAGDVGAWQAALSDWAAEPPVQMKVNGVPTESLRLEEEAFFYESIYRRYLPVS